jgi:glycerophosphoryl diester phosphodiesterase
MDTDHIPQPPVHAVDARAAIVIAHRGASGYRPEHTLASYELAIEQGADYIEPDLVITKDGVLVARHENEIGGTTDIARRPEFAGRRTTKTIDGAQLTGWFTEDLTLAELKTLRAIERIPAIRPANAAYDGGFEVPTLAEVIELARRRSRELGRTVGIYPETKHPSYFRGIGLPLEERLVAQLHAAGYTGRNAPVFIQSFEVGNLRQIRSLTQLPLVQLMAADGAPFDFVQSGHPRRYADLATAAGLEEIARYADAIGPEKSMILPRDAAGKLLAPTRLVADAHAAGLRVHPWTFRREDDFLPLDYRGKPQAEIEAFLATGVDGFFTDNPDIGVEAARLYRAR